MKKIALIVSEFNAEIATRLLKGAEHALQARGVTPQQYDVVRVPGAFEIPFMAAKLADTKAYDGIVALGVVIKGETDHYEAVCQGVTYGIQKVSIEARIPIMFGVLMCAKRDLALARSQETAKYNKGYECVEALFKLLVSGDNA